MTSMLQDNSSLACKIVKKQISASPLSPKTTKSRVSSSQRHLKNFKNTPGPFKIEPLANTDVTSPNACLTLHLHMVKNVF